MRTSVLLVGEHPFGCTGNGNMLSALLCDLDPEEFNVSVFAIETRPVDLSMQERPFPFRLYPAQDGMDSWGSNKLLKLLNSVKFDMVFMVGIDIWRYYLIMPHLTNVRNAKHFKWGWLFPFDTEEVRTDWIDWMNLLDFPCVYSQYGYDKLESHVPKLRHYRPALNFVDQFKPLSKERRLEVRHELFTNMADDDFLFGFVGPNQFRKDPQSLLTAFALVHNKIPNTRLYIHTDLDDGIFNLRQHIRDLNLGERAIYTNPKHSILHPSRMNDLYGSFDCLVNCSIQEGLSWTPLEAMLCGIPVIASETTSQTELIKDVAILVPCTERTWVPMITAGGESMIEAKRCHAGRIASSMSLFLMNDHLQKSMSENGLIKAKEWLEGISNCADLFRDVLAESALVAADKVVKKAILFMQHSAAGDVFMTTRCFKGLKERHSDLPLHYMTLPQYKPIIERNPYVEKVLDWDEAEAKKYQVVYNPHGDRIAPGQWGRNCNSILSDFYWKILRVEPDDFYIPFDDSAEVQIGGIRPFIIVHTTGGDPQFRTYKYMKDVCEILDDKYPAYTTIQIGGKDDFYAGADLDLRGQLSFNETAHIVYRASAAVTVDSFVSHLCGALGISQVCLFGSGNYMVVRPNQVKGTLVCMVPDYIEDCKGLGPCSAAVRDCSTPCTGKHDPKDIIKMLDYVLDKTYIDRDKVIAYQAGERKVIE